jgi:hypothetical protein
MLPGSLLGIAVAGVILWFLRDRVARLDHFLKLLIGASSLLFVAWQWMPKGFLKKNESREPGVGAASLAGLASGFTSPGSRRRPPGDDVPFAPAA